MKYERTILASALTKDAATLHRRMLPDAASVLTFALAGNATFTLVSKVTGARFTYKVRQCENKRTLFFVSLMNGPDNEHDYAYMGVIVDNEFALGRKSRITEDAPSYKAFQWFWKHVQAESLPDSVEVWHEGKCCRCGRKLTVPESIDRGIGPECVQRIQPRQQTLSF